MELHGVITSYGDDEAWEELNFAQRVRTLLRMILADKLPEKVDALKRVFRDLLMGIAPREEDVAVVAQWLDVRVEAVERLVAKVIDQPEQQEKRGHAKR